MKRAPKALSLLASVLLLACLVPGAAMAQEADIAAGSAALETQDANIASGTWGTCPWEISSGGTLTVHPGKGQDNRPSSGRSAPSPWSSYSSNIKQIVFASEGEAKVIAPDSCCGLFSALKNATSIDLSGFDSSQTTDMSYMFGACSELEYVNVDVLDTSEVKNMEGMFSSCRSIEKLDVSSFDTSNVADFAAMFLYCESLKELDVSNFDTRSVDPNFNRYGYIRLVPGHYRYTNEFDHMFACCESLELLKVDNFDFSNATSMQGMFRSCSSLKRLDLATWRNTSGIRDMSELFVGCESLEAIDLSSLDTSAVTSMERMFAYCDSLQSLDLSSFDTSNVTVMQGMFSKCTKLASLDLSSFDTSNANMNSMFYDAFYNAQTPSIKLGKSFAFNGPFSSFGFSVATSPQELRWNGPSGQSLSSTELEASYNGADAMVGWWQSTGVDLVESADNPEGEGNQNSSAESGTTDLGSYAGKAKAAEFTDLDENAWYMDPATGAFPGTGTLYLDYTIAKGLMSGYKGTTNFGPHDPLSRAQTATILYRLAMPDSKATTEPAAYEDNASGLTDVASKQYYTAAVNWCVKEGIITGYKDKAGRYTTFGPDDSVSREQLATMIFRYCTKYAECDADTADITTFTDYGKISEWARDGVAYCVANKIVGGYTDGSGNFGPQDSAERCQMAKIIAVTAYMLE